MSNNHLFFGNARKKVFNIWIITMPQSLLSQLEAMNLEEGNFPPIHLWDPDHVYDFDIRIDSDGRWFHEGSEIKRTKLVKLFASILKKEGDDYFLVTPVEKARIQVEDVPFVIVEMEYQEAEEKFVFRTNLDELIELSDLHPLSLNNNGLADQALPYVDIRSELKARFNRNVYYQVVELAELRDKKLFLKAGEKDYCIGEL